MYKEKNSVDEIRMRFENDVERFSDLAVAQRSIEDAALMMDLITDHAVRTVQNPREILDIGCGAGNNTLKLLEKLPKANCTLLDLARNMLNKAEERVRAVAQGCVTTLQGDFRTVSLPENYYNIVIAAAVLHHLRDDADWEYAFCKLYAITAPGGGLWVTDMVSHETPEMKAMMTSRYANFLEKTGGNDYRDKVLAKIQLEDSPRPVNYQLELLRKVGFSQVELIWKNSVFAAYAAIKNP